MSSSVIFERLLIDLWAGILGVPVSLSGGATATKLGDARVASPLSSNNHRYFTRTIFLFVTYYEFCLESLV